MFPKRPIEIHIVNELKRIYGWTVSDEELWRGVRNFFIAAQGESEVIVVKYGTDAFVIPMMGE